MEDKSNTNEIKNKITAMEKYQMITSRPFLLQFVIVLIFIVCSETIAATSGSGVRMVAVWSIPDSTPDKMTQVVKESASLGFNAVCGRSPRLPAACHESGLSAWTIVEPLGIRPGARLQVLDDGDSTLIGFYPGDIEPDDYFQYGGEPAPGNREILGQKLVCPADKGVMPYTIQEVETAVEQGYDGVVLDFIGYRNYRSCACPVCLEGLDQFRSGNPGLNDDESRNAYYENRLVALYDSIYTQVKERFPDIKIANHIHPVYLPNLFYGQRIQVDYCATTVSWFFQPHWSLKKVSGYLNRVMDKSYIYAEPMPMLGFYCDGEFARDRKSPDRVKQELRQVLDSGARHLMVCELGHILRDKETAKAVQEVLKDK